MFIRSRDEALEALSEILELPERRDQIVQSTVKVAVCLEAAARDFMLDVQAGIIGGGLEALRKRRQEALGHLTETQVRRVAPGVDVRKDPLLDEIGTALDLLKMVDILAEVFPAAGRKHPRWELARFIHENESWTREAVEAGLRRRGKPGHAPLEAKVLGRIEERKPWWPEWADAMKEACAHYVQELARGSDAHPGANDPEVLFHVIAMSEERARAMLQRMTGTSDDLAKYLSGIRERIDLVMTAQKEAGA
jgi:hypothetical protein